MFRLLIILSLTMSHQVNASVFGGTNFGFSGYPEHECNKPTKPYKPFNFSSQWEVDSYNTKVSADAIKLDYSVIGIIPATQSTELFGKLGVGVWAGNITVGDNSESLGRQQHHVFGGGVNVNVTENATLRIEIERAVLNLSNDDSVDVTSVMIGLIHNF